MIELVTYKGEDLWWSLKDLAKRPPTVKATPRTEKVTSATQEESTPNEDSLSRSGAGSLNGYGEEAPSQSSTPLVPDFTTLKWHGGTLTPPPPPAPEEAAPQRPPSRSISTAPAEPTPEQKEKMEAAKTAAAKRKLERNKNEIDRIDGVRSAKSSLGADESRSSPCTSRVQCAPAPMPTSGQTPAQARLSRLWERVRAKEHGAQG